MIQEHKKLAVVAGVLLAVLAVLYAALLYPRQSRVGEIRERKNRLLTSLADSDWPLDPNRLESLHSQLEKEEERFGQLCEQVMDQAGAAFAQDVARFTAGGPDGFRDVVTLLDYREEYSAIQQNLQGRVQFDEAVLGLGENSDSIYVYQLLLQLWTVKDLTDLALRSGLRPVPHPEIKQYGAEGRPRPVSQISVQPLTAYSLRPDENKPYLLEFPVRLVLQGSISNMANFLKNLQRGKRFFPLSHIEIRKVVPSLRYPRTDRVEMTVECSSFFRLDSEPSGEVPDTRDKPILPAGG